MFCHICGVQIPEDGAFCRKCGTRAIVDDLEQRPVDVPTPENAQLSDDPMPQPIAYVPEPADQPIVDAPEPVVLQTENLPKPVVQQGAFVPVVEPVSAEAASYPLYESKYTVVPEMQQTRSEGYQIPTTPQNTQAPQYPQTEYSSHAMVAGNAQRKYKKRRTIVLIAVIAAVLITAIAIPVGIVSNRNKQITACKEYIIIERSNTTIADVYERFLYSVSYELTDSSRDRKVIEIRGRLDSRPIVITYMKLSGSYSSDWRVTNITYDNDPISYSLYDYFETWLLFAYSERHRDFAEFLRENRIHVLDSSQDGARQNIWFEGENIDWLKACAREEHPSITLHDEYSIFFESLIYKQFTEDGRIYVEVSGIVDGKRVVATYAQKHVAATFDVFWASMTQLTIDGRNAYYLDAFEAALFEAYYAGYNDFTDYLRSYGAGSILVFIG